MGGKIKALSKMSYAEFGELRFLDHFPKTAAYVEDKIGGVECGTGYGYPAGYAFSFFSRTKPGMITTAILMDFAHDCPVKEGQVFLMALGLPLRKGMTVAEIQAVLGTPDKEGHYMINQKEPYYLTFFISKKSNSGLERIWIGRKDLADKFENM